MAVLVQQHEALVVTSTMTEQGLPMVALTCAEQEFQVVLTPGLAQRLSWQLAAAGEVSLVESYLLNYLRYHLGLEPKNAYEALDDFRAWRISMIGPQ